MHMLVSCPLPSNFDLGRVDSHWVMPCRGLWNGTSRLLFLFPHTEEFQVVMWGCRLNCPGLTTFMLTLSRGRLRGCSTRRNSILLHISDIQTPSPGRISHWDCALLNRIELPCKDLRIAPHRGYQLYVTMRAASKFPHGKEFFNLHHFDDPHIALRGTTRTNSKSPHGYDVWISWRGPIGIFHSQRTSYLPRTMTFRLYGSRKTYELPHGSILQFFFLMKSFKLPLADFRISQGWFSVSPLQRTLECAPCEQHVNDSTQTINEMLHMKDFRVFTIYDF